MSSISDAEDWHLRSLLSQLQVTIESNPSDVLTKLPDFYGKEQS